MEMLKVGICESKDFSDRAIQMLKHYFEVSFFEGDDLKSFIQDKDAIFVRLAYQITDDLVDGCDRLKYICSPTTGLNHISVTNTGIQVVSLKGEYEFLKSIRATPEHILGLSIALLRKYSHAFLNEKNMDFDRELYKGCELYHNKVGIIGMGRVGKIIANYYQAFESTVYYYDITDVEVECCEKCSSMNDLVDNSNIIILAANYTDQNCNMIDFDLLCRMKGKYFINAARGELVDEDALIRLVENNWFAGVAVDVFSNETGKKNNLFKLIELSKDRNLIITPHIGGATYTSMMRTEEFIADKLIKCIKEDGV